MTENPRPPEHESATDPWLLDRLLAGSAAGDPVDAGEAELADLLAAMTAPATEADLVGLDSAVAAFVARQSTQAQVPSPDRSRLTRRLLRLPAAVVAASAGALTVGAVAAAAYGGVLPSALQDIAHRTIGAPAAHQAPDPSSPRPVVRPGATDGRPTPNPASTKVPGAAKTPGPRVKTNPNGKTPGPPVKTHPAAKTPSPPVKHDVSSKVPFRTVKT